MFNKSLEEILCQDFLLQKNLKKIDKIVYTFHDDSIPFDMLILQEKYILLMNSSSKNSVYFKKVFKYASFEEK